MSAKKKQKKQPKAQKVAQDAIQEEIKPKDKYMTPDRIKALWPLALAVILFLLVWKEPEVVAMDPWNRVARTLDSATRTKEPALRNEMLKRSEEILDLAKKYPGHARVQFLAGYFYYIQQQWDSAIVHEYEAFHLDSGAIINPVWPDAQRFLSSSILNKATALLREGKKMDAYELVQKGLASITDDPALNKTMGNLLINSDKFTDAIKYYEKSLAKNPNDADVYNNIGVIFSRTGENEKARQCFAKALEINPNHANARKNFEAFNR